jgi:catechol 2,3-dioxygenase
VRLQVSDLERSVSYYTRVLGLTVLARASDTATLGAGRRPLIRLHEKKGVAPAPSRGAFGLYHFAILLPDRASLGKFLAHLSALGARPGMADHLVSEALYLTDPDGLGIEVYSDRPSHDWRYVNRELRMTTDPLDVEDLLSASDGIWAGTPDGTTIGHVHLHVGDLKKAEAFYHAGLGFTKTAWSYPGALFLSAGGYHHHLGTNTWSRGPAARDDQARLLEWELLLPASDDVAAAARSLRDAGYAPEPQPPDWIVEDPWGTALRLTSTAATGS